MRSRIILASRSPRRSYLLKKIGVRFTVRTKETNESFPGKLKAGKIAEYLCRKKAKAHIAELKSGEILITADTIVWLDGKVLNKPRSFKDAVKMLNKLSGRTHSVYTGVSITTMRNEPEVRSFVTRTNVRFKKLNEEEINKYIKHYKPYDKAGSYGAQECLPVGWQPCSKEEIRFLKKIGKSSLATKSILKKTDPNHVPIIASIKGSYFNVMGLPIRELHPKLLKTSLRIKR